MERVVREIRCDAEGCDAVDQSVPGKNMVPAGWVRITIDRHKEHRRAGFFEVGPGVESEVRHYCPAHTEAAIAAATRGA